MALKVWKYVWPLPEPISSFDMPKGAELLHVAGQGDVLCIWARIDDDAEKALRNFVICGTGHDAPCDRYVGTGLLRGGALVLHVFERVLH